MGKLKITVQLLINNKVQVIGIIKNNFKNNKDSILFFSTASACSYKENSLVQRFSNISFIIDCCSYNYGLSFSFSSSYLATTSLKLQQIRDRFCHSHWCWSIQKLFGPQPSKDAAWRVVFTNLWWLHRRKIWIKPFNFPACKAPHALQYLMHVDFLSD